MGGERNAVEGPAKAIVPPAVESVCVEDVCRAMLLDVGNAHRRVNAQDSSGCSCSDARVALPNSLSVLRTGAQMRRRS